MAKQSVIGFVLWYGMALGAGATVATSCIGVNYPTVAFRCNPRQADNCPESHFCCSDDPAAEGGMLPSYAQKEISGSVPYFSGINNAQGTQGMCVNQDDIPTGSGLLEPNVISCPIPCNPTWDRGEIDVVCGASRVCCQTTEIEAADCVVDETSGEFRPATGADIPALTDWSGNAHATHQDPRGEACTTFAGGMQSGPIFLDCIAQLSVADQRGFCMQLGVGQLCPTTQATYTDACGLLNAGGVPPV